MIYLDIINKTRSSVENKTVKSLLERLINIHYPEKTVYLELIYVAEAEISKLNRTFLKRKGATDIISFPEANPTKDKRLLLGSMVICLAYLKKHQEDIEEVIIHGFIHLLGFDHEADQKKWKHILNKIQNDLSKV